MNITCCGISTFNCTGSFAQCTNCFCSCLSPYQFDGINNYCTLAKSLPGKQCAFDEDCVDGLICLDNSTCSCQDVCVYEPDAGSCVCGHIYLAQPIAAIVVGVVMGFMSIVVWIFCIMRTIDLERAYRSALPTEEYNINQLRTVSIQSPIILAMQRSFSKEVTVGHGANFCYGQSITSAEDSGRPCSAGINPDEVRIRPGTPNPYAGVENIQTPLKSGFCPTAPVNPQYPATLLSEEEMEKYFDNAPLR